LTSKRHNLDSQNSHEVLKKLGVLNYGTIFMENEKVYAETFNRFTNSKTKISLAKSHLIFPDKLANLHGYKYNIVAYPLMPYVEVRNGNSTIAKNQYFFESIAKLQNASLEILVINSENIVELSQYYSHSVKMDFSLGLSGHKLNFNSTLMTFEETAICALVPNPPRISDIKIAMIETLDKSSWICIGLIIVLTFTIWLLFKNRGAVDSPNYVLYAIILMFYAQSIAISPKNRRILMIMFHITILSCYFLSMIYQGAITSELMKISDYYDYATNLNEVFSLDHKILTEQATDLLLRTCDKYMALLDKNYVTIANKTANEGIEEFSKTKMVVITRCHAIDWLRPYFENYDYYKLEKRSYPYFVELDAGSLNPMLTKMQDYYFKAFETGLMSYWEDLFKLEAYGFYKGFMTKLATGNNMLKFEDMGQIFVMYFKGCAISLMSFILEILDYKYFRHIRDRNFKSDAKKIFRISVKYITNSWNGLRMIISRLKNRNKVEDLRLNVERLR
jgi:hypothetical protein